MNTRTEYEPEMGLPPYLPEGMWQPMEPGLAVFLDSITTPKAANFAIVYGAFMTLLDEEAAEITGRM